MKEKCIELIDYFLSETEKYCEGEWSAAIAAGYCVFAYCDFMTEFGNTEYDWQEMKRQLMYAGTANMK